MDDVVGQCEETYISQIVSSWRDEKESQTWECPVKPLQQFPPEGALQLLCSHYIQKPTGLSLGDRLGHETLLVILNVGGIFLFSCKDAHLREIAFLSNEMIVLFLIGSGHLHAALWYLYPFWIMTVKSGILWAKFKLAVQSRGVLWFHYALLSVPWAQHSLA